MPKKQPRNAYYFFMIAFREEQKKKGIVYQNLAEVQVAADPAWREAHPAVRAKYEAMAKSEKEKLKGSLDKKFTSNGVPLSEIEAQQKLVQEMQEQEIAEIKDFVTQHKFDNRILDEDIYLIDVNAYCYTSNHYFMAESTMLRFNLRDGIKDTYHECISPGRIPIGYASDVKLGAQDLGLEMPDEEQRSDYRKILAYYMDYLMQAKGKVLPPLYTMPEKVEVVQDFIRQLCNCSGEDEYQFRVYSLENLFFYLVNGIAQSPEDSYPKASLASVQLKKDIFKYTPGLACELHEQGDKAVECSKSRVQRWAFTVLDKCCAAAALTAVPGRHLPAGLDVEGVLLYKDRQSEYHGSCAASTVQSSACSSVADAACSSVWSERTKKSQKSYQYKPMRMPKQTQPLVAAPELNLSESSFPTLMSASRGRGLARNMNNLSLNK